MDRQPLVSIVTPCFNGEQFVHRLFESIMLQTYHNIELIFVNDGSTDNTESVALSFRERLEQRGIRFIYCFQNNCGQASAINTGLKYVSGEYITWPDSDDWLAETCIEVKVRELEEHTEWGLICCRSAVVSENNIANTKCILERKSKDSKHFFRDLLLENDAYFAAGAYLVRTEALFHVLQDKHIFESKSGQNWQLLLPLTYSYECGFIDDVLYYILERNNSHSRAPKQYSELIAQTYGHQEILLETIKRMKISEAEHFYYSSLVIHKYIRKRYKLSIVEGNRIDQQSYYMDMKKNGLVDSAVRLDYYKRNCAPVYLLLRLIHLPVGFMKRIHKRM